MSPASQELCSAVCSYWVLFKLSKFPSQRSALRAHHFVSVEHPAGLNHWVRYHFLIYQEMQKTGAPCPAPHQVSVGSGLWLLCDFLMLMFLHSAQMSCFAPAKNTTKGQKPALSFLQFFLGLPTTRLNPSTTSTVALGCFMFCHQLWSTSAKTLWLFISQ